MTDTGPLRTVGEHRVRLTELEALANLRTVLELCAAGALRCSDKTSRPSAATMRTLAEHLADGDFYADDPIAAFAWPLLVQAGDLAAIEGGRLRLTAKGHTAVRAPMPEVIRALWRRWLSHGVIDEFSRIEQIKGQRATNVLTAVKPRRQVVTDTLAGLPPGEWVGVDALFTTMRRDRRSPTVARTDRALWKLYLVDPQYGSLGYDGYHHWEIIEGRYTLVVMFEYAGTLGLIDIDYVHPNGERDDFRDQWGGDDLDALSRYDGLQAVRLTALGRYALGLADTYHPPADTTATVPSLKVLPNLDVVATGTITASDGLMLSAYAERTADRVWTLSSASLLAALDTGREMSELTAFLGQRTDHELPNALTTLIDDVTRRASTLTDLGHLRVIECADPALTALISNDRTLRGLCRPVGDRHLVVRPELMRKFSTALRKLGYVVPGRP
jgi:hypothetical protein